jgi:hypothetical protein
VIIGRRLLWLAQVDSPVDSICICCLALQDWREIFALLAHFSFKMAQ